MKVYHTKLNLITNLYKRISLVKHSVVYTRFLYSCHSLLDTMGYFFSKSAMLCGVRGAFQNGVYGKTQDLDIVDYACYEYFHLTELTLRGLGPLVNVGGGLK